MSNLTPEQRPDRNGNIVTRWVKSFKNWKSAERTPLPPPAPIYPDYGVEDYRSGYRENQPEQKDPALKPPKMDSESRRSLFTEAYDTLAIIENAEHYSGYDSTCSDNIDYVIDYDPDLMRKVISYCADDAQQNLFMQQVFGNQHISPNANNRYDYGYRREQSQKQLDGRLDRLRKSMIIGSAALRLFATNQDKDWSHVYGLTYIDAVVKDLAPETGASDEKVRACTSIAYIHGAHKTGGGGDKLGVSQSEIEFFTDNLDRIEPFIPQLLERKTTGVEIVRDMINGASVLSEGAL
jgi:hypothetical protein